MTFGRLTDNPQTILMTAKAYLLCLNDYFSWAIRFSTDFHVTRKHTMIHSLSWICVIIGSDVMIWFVIFRLQLKYSISQYFQLTNRPTIKKTIPLIDYTIVWNAPISNSKHIILDFRKIPTKSPIKTNVVLGWI